MPQMPYGMGAYGYGAMPQVCEGEGRLGCAGEHTQLDAAIVVTWIAGHMPACVHAEAASPRNQPTH